jgi:hypothetical protein
MRNADIDSNEAQSEAIDRRSEGSEPGPGAVNNEVTVLTVPACDVVLLRHCSYEVRPQIQGGHLHIPLRHRLDAQADFSHLGRNGETHTAVSTQSHLACRLSEALGLLALDLCSPTLHV